MEKRHSQRLENDIKISYNIIAKVDSTPFEFGNSVMCDVSRTGLSMLVDMPIPVPMLIQMQLNVPHRPTSVFVLGKSIYCVPVEELGMYRVGVKFVGLLPPDLETAFEALRTPRRLSRSA